jgi:hypothetical protein
MANVNSPSGLRPVRHMTGGDIRVNEYSIASAYNTNLFHGDPIQMTGTGRNVALSEVGNVDNIGVFAGCRYVNSQGEQKFSKYWPANTAATDIVALVYDDPNIVFEIQCDTLAAGDIGQLIAWNAGTGSTTTGISGVYGDVGAGTASTAKALRLMELKRSPDNAYGAYAKAYVTFAEHALKGVVSGVGGV